MRRQATLVPTTGKARGSKAPAKGSLEGGHEDGQRCSEKYMRLVGLEHDARNQEEADEKYGKGARDYAEFRVFHCGEALGLKMRSSQAITGNEKC